MNDIKIVEIIESTSGSYVYCKQYINDIPVFATNLIIFINKNNTITYILNEFRNVTQYKDIKSKSSVSANAALKVANEYMGIKNEVIDEAKAKLIYFESIDKGLELAWKVNITSKNPIGDWQIFVSADDEHIIHVKNVTMFANGNGKVFIPNPLVSADVTYGYNNCYLYNYGTTNSCLDNQLKQVILNDITYENGQYKLKGPYCVIEDIEQPYGYIIPQLSTPDFYYTREQTEFISVMCYYHVDLSARRILQLGYNIPDELKNLRVDPMGLEGFRNAYFKPGENYLAFGGGYNCVPAAEDADIIWHEHAHAIQWNFTPSEMSYSGETQSVQEGSSDYWSTSYKRSLYPNNWAALALWFEMDIPLAMRRADLEWIYPIDYVPGHEGGQIWSSALMKIWGDLGKDITDKLFLETHLIWGQSPSMRSAATAFMQADINLYDGIHLCYIMDRFNEYGLISPEDYASYHTTKNLYNQNIEHDTTIINCSNINVQNVTVTNGAKLELEAAGKITINAPFEVELGSELKIKTSDAEELKVIISELLYDTPLSESSGPNRYNGEFVTIYNYGDNAIDVSGWRLVSDGSGQSFTFPSGSIMESGAKFYVAYRNVNGNFSLADLYLGFELKENDREFYQRAIIHANTGESITLHRADDVIQDKLSYDGTSGSQPRLEALNQNDIPGYDCVSLQRANVTVVNGVITFSRSDWTTKPVSLEQFPALVLTENEQ